MEGIFQVIKKSIFNPCGDFSVIGTAFIIETENRKENEYFLLTAYHNITESFSKNETIMIRDNEKNNYSVEIVYPKIFFSYDSLIHNDFALLKLVTDKEYESFAISETYRPAECFVRGSAIYFSNHTNFTPFKGNVYWKEYSHRVPGEELLVLDIDVKSVFDQINDTYVDLQKVLEGVSGAPILVKQNNAYVVCGIFVRLFEDGNASKCYGVTMSTIIKNCLSPLGLYTSVLSTKIPEQITKTDNSLDAQLYIELLFDNPTKFSLEDCKREAEIWNKISNQFYHGFAVDNTFYRVIYSDDFLQYSGDAQVAIRYYLARLLFKRGKKKLAYEQFAKIMEKINQLSSTVNDRMSALLSARNIVESEFKSLQLELDEIRTCGEKIIKISNADSIYIANELASITGRGLTNFFSNPNPDSFSSSIKNAVNEIFDTHTFLLKQYPIPLQKQDVVNTSIAWLTNIWRIQPDFSAEKLRQDVLLGFEQAIKRENSIFHIQSLVAYSIFLLIIEEKKEALTALFLVALLMKRENLKTTHEGLSQLLHFIQSNYENHYCLFMMFFNLNGNDEKAFLEKASKYSIGCSTKVTGASLHKAHYITSEIYQNLHKKIFLGDINEIIELL